MYAVHAKNGRVVARFATRRGAEAFASRGRTARSPEDVSDQALKEIASPYGHAYRQHRSLVEAAIASAPKKLGVTHAAALKRVGDGLFLGPWANALIYGVKYWPKSEHRALIQLVKRGDLRVERVRGEELEKWKAGVTSSQHANSYFAYVIVPNHPSSRT